MITLNDAIFEYPLREDDDFQAYVDHCILVDIDYSIGHLCRAYRGGKPLMEIMKRLRPRPNYASLSGALFALEKQIGAHFDSPLARDYLITLDFNSSVYSFTPKPIKVTYMFEGKAHICEPTVLVHFRRTAENTVPQPQLVDIRSQRELRLHTAENQERFAACAKECNSRGWQFTVLTEAEIRTPFLSNAKFFLPFRKYPAMEPEHSLLCDAIPILTKTTPAKLMERAFSRMQSEVSLRPSWHPDESVRRGRMLAMVWKVVADGFLKADFQRQRIDENTEVWCDGGTYAPKKRSRKKS
jgi:hypothetical protein